MKISLLGQFGSGNSGNDGSLESMLISLRRLRPDVEFLCICSNPMVIEARYGVLSVSVGGPPLGSAWTKIANKMLMRLPRRLSLLYFALSQLGAIDLMIIPGTGILDDFQESAFGWPAVIFFWCLAARLRRTKIAFVSIGAGPIRGRLSRWLLGLATKMASYRSYRDDYSLDYVESLGIDVSGDHRYPDIAFALPAAPGDYVGKMISGRSLVVGVGIMTYRGWKKNDPQAEVIYNTYVQKITAVISGLTAQGHRVRVFMGDATDKEAGDDVRRTLAETLAAERYSQVEICASGSLHEIMRQLATVDLAIVSRYHNLVCALKLGRPTISLGYAQKNDDLMEQFGQRPFCRHIETFELDELGQLFGQLIHHYDVAAAQIRLAGSRLQLQLREQEELLATQFLAAPP